MSNQSRYRSGNPSTDNALALVSRDIQALEQGAGNVPTYTVATLSTALSAGFNFVLVSNETGGFTAAFHDGTNWRRVQDRAVCA